MVEKAIWCMTLVLFLTSIDATQLKAEGSAPSNDGTGISSANGKISLAQAAPELYYQLRRYPKFYGDDNTRDGGMLERSQLLGSAGSTRDFLVDHGLYFDAAVTQFYQGNLSGGNDTGSARYNGSADYWLTLDTGKAGLWSGGAIFLHAESSWQADRTVNTDIGAFLPENFDATMPTPRNSEGIALPELYMVQALPANFLFLAGKANWAGLADTNFFANNERTQFLNTGLVNNPILGAFVPYTSLGLGGVWSPSKMHNIAVLGLQKKGDATTSGFDNFNGDYSVGGQYQFSPTLGGSLPGNYRVLVGATNKDIVDFESDPRDLIAQIIGPVPVARKSGNYAFLLNFDQYLLVKDRRPDHGRKNLPPVGIGLFGRAGWAPEDRNVIDQFYSFGVGGYGMLIPGRDNDQWGLGWSGTHNSSDLRDIVERTGIDLNSFGHAFEAFYNFPLTPAIHLTVDAQVVDSAKESIDTSFALGARLQVDL